VTDKIMTAHYAGQRQLQGGGIGHFWVFTDKERVYTKQIAPASVGEEWSFHVEQTGENLSVTTAGKDAPKQTGVWAEGELKKAWAALDAAHVQIFREERAYKALAKRESEIERACRPLRELFATLRSRADQEALLRAVAVEIRRGVK
jgi:hypothetical protein